MQRSIPLLWLVVICLLVLNLGMLYGLNRARLTAVSTLNKVETMLDRLTNETLVYNVDINQAVPLKADIPFDQTIEVPLNTVAPIDQVITISGLQVPLKTEVPVKMVVPVRVNKTISVDTTVRLKTTVPVKINLAQTSLAAYLTQARLLVSQLKSLLLFTRPPLAVEGPVFVPPSPTYLPNTPPPKSTVITPALSSPTQAPVPPPPPPLPSDTVFPPTPIPPTATSQPAAPPNNSDPGASAKPPPGPIVTGAPGDSGQPTPPPTASPLPAQPDSSTPTVTPTIIPASPTATPIGSDPALLAYAETVSSLGGQISAAGESLQQAALTYQAGGSTLAEFETAFRHFETNVQPPIEQINALTPPPAATGVHQKLTAGLGQCNQAINFMNEWFKTQQEDAKQMTSVLVFSCVSQVKAAEEELKGLVAK